MKLEDCKSESELAEYKKQEDEKIDYGVLAFWIYATIFTIGFFIGLWYTGREILESFGILK